MPLIHELHTSTLLIIGLVVHTVNVHMDERTESVRATWAETKIVTNLIFNEPSNMQYIARLILMILIITKIITRIKLCSCSRFLLETFLLYRTSVLFFLKKSYDS